MQRSVRVLAGTCGPVCDGCAVESRIQTDSMAPAADKGVVGSRKNGKGVGVRKIARDRLHTSAESPDEVHILDAFGDPVALESLGMDLPANEFANGDGGTVNASAPAAPPLSQPVAGAASKPTDSMTVSSAVMT